MLGSLRTALLAMLAAGVLTHASGVAAAATVDDGAKLFSKDAVEKAEKKIAQIKRDYRRDVVVETFAEAKDMKRAKENKNAFFEDWGEERSNRLGINGVHVLICKNPGRVEVTVRNQDRKLFDRERKQAIVKKFTSRLEKEPDEALLAGVSYIGDVYNLSPRRAESPAPVTGGAASSTGGEGMGWVTWVVIILVALLVMWLVVGLIRAFSGNYGGGGQPGYGGGGGFFSSMLGGLFGAAAGMYLYHSMFGGGTSNAWGGGYDNTGGVNGKGKKSRRKGGRG